WMASTTWTSRSPEQRSGPRNEPARRRRGGSSSAASSSGLGSRRSTPNECQRQEHLQMSDVIEKRSIGSALADGVVAAAQAKAAGLGSPRTVAIGDESGLLKALSRGDGAVTVGVELAPAKARLAAAFGAPTAVFHEMGKDDAAIAASLVGAVTGVALLG